MRAPVTVSLPLVLVRRLDRLGKKKGLARSRLYEGLLIAGERGAARKALAEELELYYGSRTVEEKTEDEASSRAFAQAGRAVNIDEGQGAALVLGRRKAARQRR